MNQMQSSGPFVPIALALAVVLAVPACAPQSQPEAGAVADSSTIVPEPGLSEAPEPGLEAAPDSGWTTTGTRVERRTVGAATLTGIRTATQDGFDRIVLDFGADSIPGYDIAFVEPPVTQCGSGATVALAGEAWLRIRVEPANAHTEAGAPTAAPRERLLAHPNVKELELTCDFEAQVEWVAGLATRTSYRIYEFGGPSRLVVDVRHLR